MTGAGLLLAALVSAGVFVTARAVLLSLPELTRELDAEQDTAMKACLVALQFIGTLAMLPVFVASGLVFLTTVAALVQAVLS